MTKINLIYEGDRSDVDILLIPDGLTEDIDRLAQQFLDWVSPEDDTDGWVVLDGQKYMAKKTTGFLKWLNANYCHGSEKAYIYKAHAKYCDPYGYIEF